MAGFRERVEAALLAAVAAEDELMAQMGVHLIDAGGKRQRPLFAVASAALSAGDAAGVGPAVTDDVVRGGVAVELVQVGSLYHDDVIDEAVTRRGAESVNARWGNLKAILAGDFLLAKASEIAAVARHRGGRPARRHDRPPVRGRGARAAGRLRRRAAPRRPTSPPSRARPPRSSPPPAASAASSAGSPATTSTVLTEFGRRYGMAFQVVDDVLDVVATDEQLGKPAGHDIAEGIYNLPVLRALAAGDDELRALLGGPIDGAELDRARDLVRASVGVPESIKVAEQFVHDAVATLAPFGERPAATALAGAAQQLLVDLATITG